MKILILANNDVGLYQFRRELIENLLAKHKVLISLPDGAMVKPLSDIGCEFIPTPVDRRGINPIKDFSLLIKYYKIIKKEKPGMVITYTIKPNIYGGIICRLLKTAHAGNITGLGTAFQNDGVLKKIVTAMYKPALKKSKVVFFENSENMQTLLNEKIVKKPQCCLLNGAGVNLEHFAYASYPEESEPVKFLFIGRVMKEKGVDELFYAVRKLFNEGVSCELHMLGQFEENYSEIIAGYESEGWLKYHGYREDVRAFIEKSHCFVLPSYHEGMANTNLECAAMGRPVITSNIHGCLEAVIDNESGFLVEPQNAESVYCALKRFAELSNEERIEMGKSARRHMEKVFDKNKVVEETVKTLCKATII